MHELNVAIIGTGPHPEESREEKGYSMGYRHAEAYNAVEGCTVVACCDLVADHVDAFAEEFGISPDGCFGNHEAMLDAVDVDLVSVCTPPKMHLPIVTDCAEYASVRGIHCEKPVAPTWGECTRMVDGCAREGVQLTFNYQNRGLPAVDAIAERLADGEIGDLRRVEISRADLMQTGVHNIDLANYFAGDPAVEWVIGQADAHEERMWYTDMHVESQGLGLWGYENGVHGVAFTGEHANDVQDAGVRLTGDEGVIELRFWSDNPVRVRSADTTGWRCIDVGDSDTQTVVLRDVVDALRSGHSSVVCAENALRATEIVFAIWESAKRRGRVELPLTNEGNALEEVISDE